MSIDRAEVARIAELARLEIPAERIDRMAAELSSVLDFIAALRKLDLSGCEPTVFAPAEAPLREDATDERLLSVDRALAELEFHSKHVRMLGTYAQARPRG